MPQIERVRYQPYEDHRPGTENASDQRFSVHPAIDDEGGAQTGVERMQAGKRRHCREGEDSICDQTQAQESQDIGRQLVPWFRNTLNRQDSADQ